jgi:hypothetical protein
LGFVAQGVLTLPELQRQPNVIAGHGLLLQQLPGQLPMRRAMVLEQRMSAFVLFRHQTLDFQIDRPMSVWTDPTIVLDRSPRYWSC